MTIGELSKTTSITEHTLRYYEKKGLIRVDRDTGKRRCYSESDIEWILFLKRLKDTGMLLRDIKKYSDLRYEGEITIKERLEILEKHRIFVLEEQQKWNDYLEKLDNKIGIYKCKL